jgi:hypothetical protein
MNNREERKEILRLLREIRCIAGSLYDTEDSMILDHLNKNQYFKLFSLIDSAEEECKRHKQ